MAEIQPDSILEELKVNVGVIGATGLVGSTMISLLEERRFPVGMLRAFASENSVGIHIDWQDEDVVIERADNADYSGLDIVFFSAGQTVSKNLVPVVTDAGAVVIDNSSEWRKDPNVPLVVSEVNPGDLSYRPLGIIANPNCTTMIAMPVLKPLHVEAGLEALTVTTFQAVSGAGSKGIYELAEQTKEQTLPIVFPEQIAYNVIPQRGNKIGRDTDEEMKLIFETRKILHLGELTVSVTCVSVPIFTGHSLSIEAKFRDEISPARAEELLTVAEGVELSDIPTPKKAVGGNKSLVGRIRQSNVYGKRGLSLFIAGDNLRKGAALNAVQIAEIIQKEIS